MRQQIRLDPDEASQLDRCPIRQRQLVGDRQPDRITQRGMTSCSQVESRFHVRDDRYSMTTESISDEVKVGSKQLVLAPRDGTLTGADARTDRPKWLERSPDNAPPKWMCSTTDRKVAIWSLHLVAFRIARRAVWSCALLLLALCVGGFCLASDPVVDDQGVAGGEADAGGARVAAHVERVDVRPWRGG